MCPYVNYTARLLVICSLKQLYKIIDVLGTDCTRIGQTCCWLTYQIRKKKVLLRVIYNSTPCKTSRHKVYIRQECCQCGSKYDSCTNVVVHSLTLRSHCTNRNLCGLLLSQDSEKVWLEKQLDCAHPLVLNNGAPISWASSILSMYDEATPWSLQTQ